MKTRPHTLLLQLAAFCLSLCWAQGVSAQSLGIEAVLREGLSLNIPVVQVGEKFYRVRLNYQAPGWTLFSAEAVSPVDEGYAAGQYRDGVLELSCVYANGAYYSAQLRSTTEDAYVFTLASSARLSACPIPDNIGPQRGEWLRTAEAPLSARSLAILAKLGDEILVVGGTDYWCPPTASCLAPSGPGHADGAAYDPNTNTWRRIADAPRGLYNGVAVTLGTEVFVYAQTGAQPLLRRLFRYRQSEDRWDEIAVPMQAQPTMIASFGDDLLLYSVADTQAPASDWRFDTATGSWTHLPEDPLTPTAIRQVLDVGNDLYLFEREYMPAVNREAPPLRTARLRNGQWQVLPAADTLGRAPSLIAGTRLIAPQLGCSDGGRANNYGRCVPYGAVFDTQTDSWQPLPNAPGRGLLFQSSGALSASELSLITPGYPALDTTTDQWFLFPRFENDVHANRNIQAVGRYGFVFGGARGVDQMLGDAWIWRP